MADIIQIRRDLAAEWTTVNPILADGEFGYETDTKLMKIGDAVTAWNDLPYFPTTTGALLKTNSIDNDDQTLLDLIDSDTVTAEYISPGKVKFHSSGAALITITKTALDTAISGAALIPGQLYKIIGVDATLYGGTDIFIRATDTNRIEKFGVGVFYNPKDIGLGWNKLVRIDTSPAPPNTFMPGETINGDNGATGVFQFQAYGGSGGLYVDNITGDWTLATSFIAATSGTTSAITSAGNVIMPAIGDKIIYGGMVWQNNNGNLGTATDRWTLDSSEWTSIPYNTNDYDISYDIITYDYANDTIVYRKDLVKNNEVGFEKLSDYDNSPIKVFRWWEGGYWGTLNNNNSVINSYFDIVNAIKVQVINNKVGNQSFFYDNVIFSLQIQDNIFRNCYIDNNHFSGASINNNDLIQSVMEGNIMENGSSFRDNVMNFSTFSNNYIVKTTIENNEMYSYSSINDNLMRSTQGIGYNFLLNSTIQSNIFQNSINTGGIDGNHMNLSYIESCIFDAGGSGIRYNHMLNSTFWACVTEGGVFYANDLRGSYITVKLSGAAGGYTGFRENIVNNTSLDWSAFYLNNKTMKNCRFEFLVSNEDVSAATILFQWYLERVAYTRPDGTNQIRYYDDADALVIVGITT